MEEKANINLPANDSGEGDIRGFIVSERSAKYLEGLASALGVELLIRDRTGQEILRFNKNPVCSVIEASGKYQDCPESCLDPERSKDEKVFKCNARITVSRLDMKYNDEVISVFVKYGYSDYDDFIEITRIFREYELGQVPVSGPVKFIEKEKISTISRYISLALERLIESYLTTSTLEDKIMRMASLFDPQTFSTLSRNPPLLYRFVLDSIGFVFGGCSSGYFHIDEEKKEYKPICTYGEIGEKIKLLIIPKEHALVNELITTRALVRHEKIEEVFNESKISGVMDCYFFPMFYRDELRGILGIFGKSFSYSETKVISAFLDYIGLNMENRELRATHKGGAIDTERINLISEFSTSIAPVLSREKLMKLLLDKTLEIVKAEQGSIMLLDKNTSELVVEASRSKSNVVREKMRIKKGEGIAGMVVESGESILVKDIEQDPRIRQENRPHYRTKSFISAMINVEDRIKGVLNLSDKAEGGTFNEEDLELVKLIISSGAVAIERSILYDQTEELKKLSITDPLTGIYNRRYLNRRLSEEITRYNRYKHPFSFMMLDLDRFKEYNDTFGHIAGDNLLKVLAQVIEKSLRSIDIAARFGGDEFVAIFPQTTKVDAIQITNRLKGQIDNTLKKYSPELPLTISMGLATYPDDASSIMELIEKTDQALYLAKKGGGNRIVYL